MSMGCVTAVVGIVANRRRQEASPSAMYATNEKYVRAVRLAAGAVPVLLPGDDEAGTDFQSLLGALDGVLLTGGASNIEPDSYGQTPAPGEDTRDPGRDRLALELIPMAVEMGIPVFGICRGIQEMNVAFGGTLHQRLHDVPGREDHRRERDKPWAEQFDPRQRITITEGGVLHKLVGQRHTTVNSLHGQGLDRVAERLHVEAVADDGTVEAVSVAGAKSFALSVQWHAEHDVLNQPVYLALFKAFGEALRARVEQRGVRTHRA